MNESTCTSTVAQRYLTAIEWKDKCDQIKSTLKTSRYNPDIYKLYNNIQNMITELSKIEVQARQKGLDQNCLDQNRKIQESVDYLEKLVLMLKLMD